MFATGYVVWTFGAVIAAVHVSWCSVWYDRLVSHVEELLLSFCLYPETTKLRLWNAPSFLL